MQIATVAGFLGRPIYYLECECEAPSWFGIPRGQARLSPEEFGRRLTKAVTLAGHHDTILIRNWPVSVEYLTCAPNVSVVLLKAFTKLSDAASTDDNLWLYRVSEKKPP